MRNPYTQNLSRIEFVITYACTGRCKHCSEGEHSADGVHIDGDVAAESIRKTAAQYRIESVMTFGGEPLLYPAEVCKIHAAAREAGIPKRQLITNGFFSRDDGKIQDVAGRLAECSVNDILLSVDAFHQETIPLAPVMSFARAALAAGSQRVRAHPAWLTDQAASNPYNDKTREILSAFSGMGVEISEGNIIFPSGNARKYLKEYFDPGLPQRNPYEEDPRDIRAVCVNPNGDVLGGNIYTKGLTEILANHMPE